MRPKSTTRNKISVHLSDGLRRQLADAQTNSGRTLTAEVEARLRQSLNSVASDRLLLLKFDQGLYDWLRAHTVGIGLSGGMEENAIFLIRSQIIEDSKNKNLLAVMLPHLPFRIQDAIKNTRGLG